MHNVYLVEDSAVIQECIQGMVEDIDGLSLVGMSDNEPQALREIEELQPDVVILDLYIDRGTGFSVLKHTKAAHPHIKVIVLTNLNGSAMVEKCREYGADAFLDKTRQIDVLEEFLIALVQGQNAPPVVPSGG